jgi:quercetin dioxygenase-like cupin family protein
MKDFDRRSAIALGLATATAALAMPRAAAAETYGPSYGPNDGQQRAPGVRQVDLGKHESMMPAYKTVSMRDIIYQPGAKTQNPGMQNDMVCHCLTGELHLDQGGGKQFVAKQGDVWTCAKGMPENTANNGSTVAIMRVTDLLT